MGCHRRAGRKRSGSVVECLTRDREAAGSSLTGVTAWSVCLLVCLSISCYWLDQILIITPGSVFQINRTGLAKCRELPIMQKGAMREI